MMTLMEIAPSFIWRFIDVIINQVSQVNIFLSCSEFSFLGVGTWHLALGMLEKHTNCKIKKPGKKKRKDGTLVGENNIPRGN